MPRIQRTIVLLLTVALIVGLMFSPVAAEKKILLKVPMAYPSALPGLGTTIIWMAERVELLSDNRLDAGTSGSYGTVVDRDKWSFGRIEEGRFIEDNTYICSDEGFKAGMIYELTYVSDKAVVTGLGLAAIRDIISYAKYDPDCPFKVEKGIAAGVEVGETELSVGPRVDAVARKGLVAKKDEHLFVHRRFLVELPAKVLVEI